jgi:membrane-bound serine protease (ClpP class)
MATIVTLLILGAVLMFLETLLPGLVAGIMGFICLLAAVYLAYGENLVIGNTVLGIVIGGLIGGTWAWLKFFPESRMARRFVSQQAVGDLGVEKPELLHGTGTTLTALRPSGVATINGQRVDVVAESGFIERDANVKVVTVEGSRVVVRMV